MRVAGVVLEPGSLQAYAHRHPVKLFKAFFGEVVGGHVAPEAVPVWAARIVLQLVYQYHHESILQHGLNCR